LKLRPKQRLRHECGLDFLNTTPDPIEFPNGLCPQCKGTINKNEISGGQEYTKWVLIPLPGMSFKNEMGSEVTLTFEVGREIELFQYLQNQINAHIQRHFKSLETIKQKSPETAREILTQAQIMPPNLPANHEGTVHPIPKDPFVFPNSENSGVREEGEKTKILPISAGQDQSKVQHLTFGDDET
jgi:hypothetical protein